MKIALVNCVKLPESDPDEAPLLDALRAAGHQARSIAWDADPSDPASDPGAYDACVIRATWNYHRAPDAFAAWVKRAGERTTLINPPETVLWNMHKKYLGELQSRRIAIVPTLWADKGRDADFLAHASAHGWDKIVIKPAVSGGSRETRVFDLSTPGSVEAAKDFLKASSDREDTMVQKYIGSVERGGEVCLICLGGVISHAIEKRPRFAGHAEDVAPRPVINEPERRFAMAVLEACRHDITYARIDIIIGEQGEIMLSELELIEPSLYFEHGPGSAERLVRAIEQRRGQPSTPPVLAPLSPGDASS